ncbi:class II fumarate hydratase, partial [Myxococcota bacterium]
GSELLGGVRGSGRLIHPNDHVNLGQSTNDVFPSAVSLACLEAVRQGVMPALRALAEALTDKSHRFADVVKLGRTHWMDATPLTLGQEMGGWAAQVNNGLEHLGHTLPHLAQMALGGTAVGTGLNTHPEYADRVVRKVAELSGQPVTPAPNKFEALGAHDSVVAAHGALRGLAISLTKIANDVRCLASGPRAGLGEITIPENEPGSSIMPGKVNPTQCEALTMLCAQVLGNDVAIGWGGASGHLELNVYRPLLAHCFLQSARLLTDGGESFRAHLVEGIRPNHARIRQHLDQSLMLVTALTPHIGYDRAAQIAKRAHAQGTTLREAAIELGWVSAEEFDAWVRPELMLSPRRPT